MIVFSSHLDGVGRRRFYAPFLVQYFRFGGGGGADGCGSLLMRIIRYSTTEYVRRNVYEFKSHSSPNDYYATVCAIFISIAATV